MTISDIFKAFSKKHGYGYSAQNFNWLSLKNKNHSHR